MKCFYCKLGCRYGIHFIFTGIQLLMIVAASVWGALVRCCSHCFAPLFLKCIQILHERNFGCVQRETKKRRRKRNFYNFKLKSTEHFDAPQTNQFSPSYMHPQVLSSTLLMKSDDDPKRQTQLPLFKICRKSSILNLPDHGLFSPLSFDANQPAAYSPTPIGAPITF